MALLEKSKKFNGVEGPLLTIVMDGVGIAPKNEGNAVHLASTPTLDMLFEKYPNISIKKFPVLIPEFEKFKARYEEANGVFPEKFFNSSTDNGIPFSGIKIIFKIERYDTCILGDNL